MGLTEEQSQILSRLSKASERGFAINVDLSKLGRSTVIWLAGISGFVLANAKPYWEGILGDSFFKLDPLNFLLVYSPSLVVVFFGFLTMKAMEDWMGIYTRYYIAYSGAIDLYSLKDETFVNTEVLALLYLDSEESEDLQKIQDIKFPKERKPIIDSLVKMRTELNSITKKSNELYKFTSRLFYFHLAWVYIAPFLIRV